MTPCASQHSTSFGMQTALGIAPQHPLAAMSVRSASLTCTRMYVKSALVGKLCFRGKGVYSFGGGKRKASM